MRKEPARKYPPRAALLQILVDLDEPASLRRLPWLARLARAQVQCQRAEAGGVAGVQREFARHPAALVERAHRGEALGHWGGQFGRGGGKGEQCRYGNTGCALRAPPP